MIKPRLFSLLKGSNRYLCYTILWNIALLLLNAVIVFTLARILSDIRIGIPVREWVAARAAILGAAVCLRFFCQKGSVRAFYLASVRVKKTLRERIYRKLLELGISYQERFSTAEVVQAAMEGVDQLEVYFGKYLPQLAYSLLAPVILFFLLLPVNGKAPAVLLICVPLIPVSIVAVQKFAKRLLSKYWDSYTGLGDSFLENLSGLTTLKIYQADEKKTEEMDREAEHFRKITMKVLTMQLNSISVMDLAAYGGAAAGMITGLLEYQNGGVDFFGLLAILLLASEFFLPLRLLGSYFHIAMNGMAASDKIFALLDMEAETGRTEELSEDCLDIEARNLTFSYGEGRKILSDVSFSIPKGSFFSFAGRSGCGKSTIAGLLCGYNRKYEGSIRIGGKELCEISEESLMKNVTLVSHNGYLFAGTVEENLRMGRKDAAEEMLWEALRKVRLDGFIRQSGGLSMELKEQASNLSGGQRQRLVIARALLKDSPIYIFDEATSNIDVESENAIMEVIHGLKGVKTVILISHRLENVRPSDGICLLEGGRAAESGTHDELYRKGGAYTRMYQSQEELMKYSRREAMT